MTHKLFLSIALILSFSFCYAKDDDCLNFGKNIKVFTDLEKLLGDDGKRVKNTLDLNGDGVKDRVVLLSIGERAVPAKNITLSSPFVYYATYANVFEDPPHIAIGIIHSATKDKPCKSFIIRASKTIFYKWDGTIDNFFIDNEPLITMPPCLVQYEWLDYDMFCVYPNKDPNRAIIYATIFALYWDKEKEKYQEGNQVFEEP
jgi:hypothetical protein